ncbi:ABC transporter permease subunit [Ruminococcus sp.]|uniref:ABC transporter permease subunit n=1 Tax=Ruminococcus sp. TaxID=41978 RepID=UPI0025FE447A|nr:ABC transporter permease subunit [Ruminococcus sp.]MBQ8965588.1 ABC transporter permease subunit [Ruminococcus sp.]
MGAVFRREVRSYFTSPIGYIFIAAFFAYAGIMFSADSLSSGYTKLDSLFYSLLTIIIVLIPILTMRTIADEKRTRTDQCLLTAPVSLGGIVAGKFFAAFLVYAVGVSITAVMAIVVSVYGDPDWNVVVGNIVALLLLGGAFIAIGIFCSSFTENQVVAAVISFIVLIAVSFLSVIGSLLPALEEGHWYTKAVEGVRSALEQLSFAERYFDFTYGIFNFSNVVFFISAIVAFLFLTVRVLEKRRWS